MWKKKCSECSKKKMNCFGAKCKCKNKKNKFNWVCFSCSRHHINVCSYDYTMDREKESIATGAFIKIEKI